MHCGDYEVAGAAMRGLSQTIFIDYGHAACELTESITHRAKSAASRALHGREATRR